jgi:hypothetical protein
MRSSMHTNDNYPHETGTSGGGARAAHKIVLHNSPFNIGLEYGLGDWHSCHGGLQVDNEEGLV